MKRLSIALMAALMLVACHKDEKPEQKNGSLSLKLACDTDDYILVTKAGGTPDPSTFAVSITQTDGVLSYSWDSFAKMPELVELVPGNYDVKVSSSPAEPVAWDQPVYGASASFNVVAGMVSDLNMVCSIQNMKVTMNCSDRFMKELSEFNITVTSDDGHLVWTKADVLAGKAGFFAVSPLKVSVQGFRTLDGQSQEAIATCSVTNVAAKDHHVINLDAKTTGQLSKLSLSVDPSMNDRELEIVVPGLEENPVEGGPADPDPENPGGSGGDSPQDQDLPALIWPENPNFDVYPLKSEMNVDLEISAPKGIESFFIDVDSPSLDPAIKGMTSDGSTRMDLINDENLCTALSSMGIPTGNELYGKTDVSFSLSGLLPLILVYEPEIGSDHKFTLTLVDAAGNVLSQTLVFRYNG